MRDIPKFKELGTFSRIYLTDGGYLDTSSTAGNDLTELLAKGAKGGEVDILRFFDIAGSFWAIPTSSILAITTITAKSRQADMTRQVRLEEEFEAFEEHMKAERPEWLGKIDDEFRS
jgi:hypothetical protein